jgi:hypothetical protein
MHFVRPVLSSAAVLIVALGVSSALARQPNGGMTSGGSPSAGQSALLPNEGSPGQAGSDTGGPGGSVATGGEPGSPNKQMKENPTAQEQGAPSSHEHEGKSAGKSTDHEGKAEAEGKSGQSNGKAEAEGKSGTSGGGRAEAEANGGTSTRLQSQQVPR